MDAHSSRIGGLVFVSLTRAGNRGNREPYLASHWRQVTPTTYIFELRPDMVFHDGQPVTAADVAATYDSILDPAIRSPKRGTLSAVASVEATGLQQVTFRLAHRDAAFMEATGIGILPADSVGGEVLEARELVGSGPYRIATYVADDKVILEAFDGFAEGVPTIGTIEVRSVPDGVMRALELRHGSVDFVQNAIDPDSVVWLEENQENLQVLRGPYDAFQYLGFNLRHEALGDRRVRAAIAHAIDREAIVDHLLRGQAQVASGLLPPHHWAYAEPRRSLRYSPRRARMLLDGAGWRDPDGSGPRPRMTLSYKTTTVELRRRIAQVLAAQLADVGIELEIESHEWATFFADIRKGNFHLYSLAWVGISDPDIYRMVFHSQMIPPEGNNRGHYRDPAIDKLTEHGRRKTRRRAEIYAQVQRRTARTLPYLPLWWPENVVVASTRLEGFELHPSGDLFGLTRARLRGAAR